VGWVPLSKRQKESKPSYKLTWDRWVADISQITVLSLRSNVHKDYNTAFTVTLKE